MKRRSRVRARRLALALAAVALSPLLAIVALRWIDPPTSAFMLRHRLLERGSPGRAADRAGAIGYRWTELEDIAPAAALAVVAAEDQLFPRHHGFDVASIEQAIAERHRRARVRGASTLSQQVAKNLFLWPGRSLVRKGLEAYLTALLELVWPKRRILEVYLNVAELGDGIYGVGAAAEVYFDKEPSQLTRREAALLAAALPNPKRRRADRPSPWMQERADWIERQIDQLGGPAHLAGVLPRTAER